MSYRHGIYSSEVPTSITPPVQISADSGICVCIGCSPIHLAAEPAKPNTPVLAHYYSDAVKQLGYSDDFDNYTICEAIKTFFVLFGVAPVVFVNVLDPDKHYTETTFTAEGIGATPANLGKDALIETLQVTSGEDKEPDELTKDTDYTLTTETTGEGDSAVTTTTLSFLTLENVTDDAIILSYKTSRDEETEELVTYDVGETTAIELDSDTILPTVKVLSGGSEMRTLKVDEDFSAARDTDGNVIVTLITDTKVVEDTIDIAYHEVDPSKVTAMDIIGGVDTMTGEITGLELIGSIYPRLAVLPGIIIAPKYSTNTAVAAVMKAKSRVIDGVFKATAIVDIDTDDAPLYTQVPERKAINNLVDTSLFVCYPKVALDGEQYHLSTQMAALMNQVDADNNGIPYVSPSNHNLQCDSAVRKDGSEIYFGLEAANYLNGNGIVTALNFASGWRLWNNTTSLYPTSTDPKDVFINIRRMFNYVSNSLILSYWSRIDNPMNKRLIESIVTSANIWLSSLVSSGALLGARVAFLEDDNAVTDLMSGVLKFRIYMTPPPPAKEITFIQEYDPDYFSTLFS